MSLIALSFAIACVTPTQSTEPGRLSIIKARDGAVVLAKTIEVLDAPTGNANNGGTSQQQEVREWKYVVLERIDDFVGNTPKRFKLAVYADWVNQSNFFAHPPSGPHGGSGPPPVQGFQPGDVAVWSMQRPDQNGRYIDNGWNLQIPTQGRIDPHPLPYFTAPASDFALSNGREGQFIVTGGAGMLQSSKVMPDYDKTLPPGFRYADLLAGMAIRDLKEKPQGMAAREDFWRLQSLRQELSGGQGIPAVATDQEFAQWESLSLTKQWPSDDLAQLNLLATRLTWGETSYEPQFLALLKKTGRPSLWANIPPISSEDYFVECCQGDDFYVANEGFQHMRGKQSRDPRVLKAANKWLEEIENPGPDERRAGDIRGCGLAGSILWYLADTSGEKSLTENWTDPKKPDLVAAQLTVEKLLRKQ